MLHGESRSTSKKTVALKMVLFKCGAFVVLLRCFCGIFVVLLQCFCGTFEVLLWFFLASFWATPHSVGGKQNEE